MEADVQKLLDALASMREKANVNACFGEPVTVEGRTVIPVARIGYGFGIGVGQGPTGETEEGTVERMGTSGGGGGGITASPLGVIEVTSKGTRIEPVVNKQRVAIASMLVAAWSTFWVARALAVICKRCK
jgi:uncharacterized spore protein YtfJ